MGSEDPVGCESVRGCECRVGCESYKASGMSQMEQMAGFGMSQTEGLRCESKGANIGLALAVSQKEASVSQTEGSGQRESGWI